MSILSDIIYYTPAVITLLLLTDMFGPITFAVVKYFFIMVIYPISEKTTWTQDCKEQKLQ